MRAAMGWADWPARMQPLAPGPLRDLLPPRQPQLWLDGGHNPAAARVVADHLRAAVPAGKPLHLVMGLLANKDATGVLRAFAGRHATRPCRAGARTRPPRARPISPTQAKANGLTALPRRRRRRRARLDRPPRRSRRAAVRAGDWARSIWRARCWRRQLPDHPAFRTERVVPSADVRVEAGHVGFDRRDNGGYSRFTPGSSTPALPTERSTSPVRDPKTARSPAARSRGQM